MNKGSIVERLCSDLIAKSRDINGLLYFFDTDSLSQRGLISVQTAQSFNIAESEVEEPACKRRKLKEEMLNELRRSTNITVI